MISNEKRLVGALALLAAGAIWISYQAFGNAGLGMTGSIASVCGLVLSAYIALTVGKIRARHLRQVIFKHGHGKLIAHRRNLSTAIKNNDGAHVRQQLARIRAVLVRVALHSEQGERVELFCQTIDSLLASDDQLVALRTHEHLHIIDEQIETLSLQLTEMEWGNDDD
jgi:hypothetical protein